MEGKRAPQLMPPAGHQGPAYRTASLPTQPALYPGEKKVTSVLACRDVGGLSEGRVEFVKNPSIIIIVTGTCGVWLQVRTGLNASVNSFKPERSAVREAGHGDPYSTEEKAEAQRGWRLLAAHGTQCPFCSWTPHLRRECRVGVGATYNQC